MIEIEKLIGLKYPIKNIENQWVGVRTIKKVADIETHAGILIKLREDSNSWILISYKEYEDIVLYNKFANLPIMESEQ